MKPSIPYQTLCWIALSGALFGVPGDLDDDGLRDEVETNTGVYISPANTGTNPSIADSDGDSLPDGMELNIGTVPTNPASKVKRPNIIYILADDTGYGDVGCFWQNQRPTGAWRFATPGLDAMAAQGAMLTHHYVAAPICAPSRCSFLQGRHQGHADIRDSQFDKPLPDGYILPRVLRAGGYKTVHIGKAGLAGRDPNNPSAHPLTRGFDRFFGTLTHGQAHEHYPRNGTTSKLARLSNDFTLINDAHQDLYTQDVYTAFAKKVIVEEVQNNPHRPFFIYLSLDTPHFLGQFPPTRDYPAGKGLSGGVQWTGAPSYVNTAVNDPSRIDNVANRHLDIPASWYPGAQKFVAMTRRLDDSVSDILQTLRDLEIDDDTLVVFTSDNGPDPTEVYPPSFGSFGPFEGIKGDFWEGGIRVPTIVWWPGTIPATRQLSNIRRITTPCANYDWFPTFAELAKVPVPARVDGRSLVGALNGSGSRSGDYLYFEMWMASFTPRYPEFTNHGGETRGLMQAIRIGDLKGVRYNIQSSQDAFRIYDVVNDPKESINLAPARPELQEKMRHIAISGRRAGGGVSRPYDNSLIPAVTLARKRNGLDWKSYEGYWPWLPDLRTLTPVTTGRAVDMSSSPRSRDTDVGLSFEGYLSVPTSGAYTFQTTSNGAVALWVHDGHVIDNDYNFTPTKTSAPVNLAAGLHPIRLHYRQVGGASSFILRYSGPGITLQPVPASAFFVEGSPPVLVADSFILKRNTPYLADLLANDISESPLTLLSGGSSILGATLVVGNQMRFEPFPDRLGLADFSYTASDGIGLVGSQARATVLFDNERWIPFEEGAGSMVRSVGDSPAVVGDFSGIVDPAMAWRNGRFGTALHFDGIDDQVNFPGMSLPTGAAERTFSCWIRTNSRSAPEIQSIFSYGTNLQGRRFLIRLSNTPNVASDQAARLDVHGGYAQGTRALNDGQWHHLAIVVADHNRGGTVNVNETKFYVDGLPDLVTEKSGEIIATGSSLVPALGGSNHHAGFNFQGSVDDLRIFPRALSDAEIAALHASEPWYLSPPPEANDTRDGDGDGMSDVAEEVAGTDPENPSSILKILEMTHSAGSVSLKWQAVAGRRYLVEESVDLSSWQPVVGVAPVDVTTAAFREMIFPRGASTKCFYRIRVTVSP